MRVGNDFDVVVLNDLYGIIEGLNLYKVQIETFSKRLDSDYTCLKAVFGKDDDRVCRVLEANEFIKDACDGLWIAHDHLRACISEDL